MKRYLTVFLLVMSCNYCYANSLETAIVNAKSACSGISDAMLDLKKMAGINTAVTAVGTVAGGVALVTGIAKKNVDKEYDDFAERIRRLLAKNRNVQMDPIIISDREEFSRRIDEILESEAVTVAQADADKLKELEQKSKMLGNIRTGTLAASTMTNIAGTAIAANNKVDDDLETKINNCVSAIKNLSKAKLSAKVEQTASETEINQADNIITRCRDWEVIDLKPINKRAKGATISSGIGIGTGAVGTITSAVANTDSTRHGDEEKEKRLNTTANIMAGASTAASAAATIFNAAQISAIKKAVVVADECEGALK